MSLTTHEDVVKFGAKWYADRYLAAERARERRELLEIAAGLSLLVLPLLVATIGYLVWRLVRGGTCA